MSNCFWAQNYFSQVVHLLSLQKSKQSGRLLENRSRTGTGIAQFRNGTPNPTADLQYPSSNVRVNNFLGFGWSPGLQTKNSNMAVLKTTHTHTHTHTHTSRTNFWTPSIKEPRLVCGETLISYCLESKIQNGTSSERKREKARERERKFDTLRLVLGEG